VGRPEALGDQLRDRELGIVRVERTPDGDNAESLRQIAFLTFQRGARLITEQRSEEKV